MKPICASIVTIVSCWPRRVANVCKRCNNGGACSTSPHWPVQIDIDPENLIAIAIAIGPRKIWCTTNRVCVGVNWRKRRFAAEWPRKGAGPAPQLLMAIGRYGRADIWYLSSIVRDENHVTKQAFQLADERANWHDRCCIGRRMMEILFSFIAAAVFCRRKNLKNR